MVLSFQDKIKPVTPTAPTPAASTGLSFADKIKKVAPTGPAKPFKYDVAETSEDKIARYTAEAQEAKKKADKANSFVELYVRPVANAVLPGVADLGDTISGITNAKQLSKMHQETVRGMTDSQAQLIKGIGEAEKAGRDTTKLKRLYNQSVDELERIERSYQDATAGANKTTGQVVGELGETALNVLTAGTYGKAAAGMKAGELAVKEAPAVVSQTANILSKNASKLATAGKIAEGAAIGEGYDIAENLRAGKTGSDVLTEGYGKYIGAAVPTLLGVTKGTASKLAELTPAQAKIRLTDNLNDIFKKGTIGVKKISDFADERGINLGEEIVNREIKPIVNNDRLKFDPEAFTKLDTEIADDSRLIDEVIQQYPDAEIKAQELKTQVAKDIANNPEAKRQGTVGDLTREANAKIDDYIAQTGSDIFNVEAIQEFKKGMWELSKKYSKTTEVGKSDAYSILGSTFRKMIEDEIPDVKIKDINAKIGKTQEVYKMLDKINSLQDGGIVLSGGKVGKYATDVAGATVGAIIGSQLGVVGGAVGAVTGKMLATILRKISHNMNVLGPIDRILVKYAEKAPEDTSILGARNFIEAVKNGKTPTITDRVRAVLFRAFNEAPLGLPAPKGDNVIELPASARIENLKADEITKSQEKIR